jgi:hypothetical protein
MRNRNEAFVYAMDGGSFQTSILMLACAVLKKNQQIRWS